MSQNDTHLTELDPKQTLAVEQLATGATIVRTAEVVGVSRETVHRWIREDWNFQAAVNATRRDIQDAVARRLLALAEKALTNVALAIDRGDVKASLAILKGLGVLDGAAPQVGSDDPSALADEAELQDRETRMARALRSVAL